MRIFGEIIATVIFQLFPEAELLKKNILNVLILILAGYFLFSAIPSFPAEKEVDAINEWLMNKKNSGENWLLDSSGGVWTELGWALAPESEGYLRLRLPGKEGDILRLRLQFFNPGSLNIFLENSADKIELPKEVSLDRIFTIELSTGFDLLVRAVNKHKQEKLVCKHYAASTSSHLPWGNSFLISFVICCLIFIFINYYQRQGFFVPICLIIGALSMAAVWRWELLLLYMNIQLDSDAIGYLSLAKSLEWFSDEYGFYSGNFLNREPLFLACLKLWFYLFDPSIVSVRMCTLFVSLVFIVVCSAFIWRLTKQPFCGVLAAWVCAMNPILIKESIRGLRTELDMVFMLLFLASWFWLKGYKGAICMGICCGLAGLTRSTNLVIYLPFLLLMWVWQFSAVYFKLKFPGEYYWKLKEIICVVLICMAMYTPHAVNLAIKERPNHSGGIARVNANLEFPERIGTPGFPTQAEIDQFGVSSGPKLSYYDYFFGMHSLSTLLYGQLKGWIESTIYMGSSPQAKINHFAYIGRVDMQALKDLIAWQDIIFIALLGFMGMVGIISLSTQIKYAWLPFMVLLGTWYVAYLYHARLIEPFRHTAQVYPLLLCCQLWGVVVFVKWVKKAFRARH